MLYVLTKISSTGFLFCTEDIERVKDLLSLHICDACLSEIDESENFIHEMLGSACGCEYDLSVYEKHSDFHREFLSYAEEGDY